MQLKDKLLAQRIYLLLGGLFITSLVVSNLIFQKFFYWQDTTVIAITTLSMEGFMIATRRIAKIKEGIV